MLETVERSDDERRQGAGLATLERRSRLARIAEHRQPGAADERHQRAPPPQRRGRREPIGALGPVRLNHRQGAILTQQPGHLVPSEGDSRQKSAPQVAQVTQFFIYFSLLLYFQN